jgi:hypothetical protein
MVYPERGLANIIALLPATNKKRSIAERLVELAGGKIGRCLNGALFELGFLVHHVLARLGIVLLDLHFFRHGALVLVGGVKVAGAGG